MKEIAQSTFNKNTFTEIEGSIPGFRFAGKNIGDILSSNFGPVTLLFFAVGVILLFYLVSGGFTLMLSKGDPGSVAKGQQKITNALIGLVIVFSAYWIVQIVAAVLGLTAITNTF